MYYNYLCNQICICIWQDYQLMVPKEKLQKVLADEIKAFSEEKENKETL
jgi:hypothetical protein